MAIDTEKWLSMGTQWARLTHTRDEELPNDRLQEWEPSVEITAMVDSASEWGWEHWSGSIPLQRLE